MSITHKQYVYHFEYPINSIDVRVISEFQFEFMRTVIDFYESPLSLDGYMTKPIGSSLYNYETSLRLLKDHFPEELI